MRLLFAVSLATAMLGTTLVQCYAATCDQLWVQRNQYYKDAGFCFETQKAIAYFGNGGCTIHGQNNVHLSTTAQRAVEQIVEQEKKQGCSD